MTRTPEEAAARQRFFFPPNWEKLSGPLASELDNVAPPFQPLGEAFRRNLLGAVATLSMPFRMALASVHSRRFQALYTADRIRAREYLQADETVPAWAEEAAFQTAQRRMDEELRDAAVHAQVAEQVLRELGRSLQDGEMSVAAAELLRQGVILTWGGLEVFIRDFFVALVNSRSDLGRQLVESDQTRKLFELKSVPFAVLAQYGFNVQSRLGEILARQYDMDSVPAMKAVFGVLFPSNPILRAVLAERSLWVFAQRRNLIVHRRGLVDSQYLGATGETLPIGSELLVAPSEIEAYMRVCCDVVHQLLLAAR